MFHLTTLPAKKPVVCLCERWKSNYECNENAQCLTWDNMTMTERNVDLPTPIPAITTFPKTLPGARGRAMRKAYNPVKPNAPVPITLHEMQSLYSRCFSSAGGGTEGLDEDAGEEDDDDDTGGG